MSKAKAAASQHNIAIRIAEQTLSGILSCTVRRKIAATGTANPIYIGSPIKLVQYLGPGEIPK